MARKHLLTVEKYSAIVQSHGNDNILKTFAQNVLCSTLSVQTYLRYTAMYDIEKKSLGRFDSCEKETENKQEFCLNIYPSLYNKRQYVIDVKLMKRKIYGHRSCIIQIR